MTREHIDWFAGRGQQAALSTTVLMLVHDLRVRIITTNGTPLRDFQLDPTRDYQPQQNVNDECTRRDSNP